MIRSILFLLFNVLIFNYIYSQPRLEHAFNSSEERVNPNDMLLTGNGHYYLAGKKGADAWVCRLDGGFHTVWEDFPGGSGLDAIEGGRNQLLISSDGGLLVGGSSASSDGDLPANKGDRDMWLIKYSATGQKQWSRNYGGSRFDNIAAVFANNSGGYTIIGNTISSDGDIVGQKGESDVVLMNLNASGQILNVKTFGGADYDYAFSATQDGNGNITVLAKSESTDGDLAGKARGSAIWVFKLSGANILWSKSYVSTADQFFISPTQDGGYMVSGKIFFADDIFENYGSDDGFLMKLDASGNMQWAKNYGGTEKDEIVRAIQISDGGYIVAGLTFSDDEDLDSENRGRGDGWFMRVTSNGSIRWSQSIGGTNGDSGNKIIQVNSQVFLAVIHTTSFVADWPRGVGAGTLILKLNESSTSVGNLETVDHKIFPNPVKAGGLLVIESEKELQGWLELFDESGRMVQRNLVTDQKVRVKDLPAGIYHYRLVDGNGVLSGKVGILR